MAAFLRIPMVRLPKLLKRIDLLVIKAFIGPFFATFIISMFLFLMHFLWKYIDELVGKGIELSILFQLIFYSLADLVPMALPLTVMVAGLMTFGNLSESFELVAMKSNGMSLRRILAPIFIIMLFLAGTTFFFMNKVIPAANTEGKALLWDLRQKKPAFNITEGMFYQQIDGFSIRVGKKEKDNETIKDVLIYEYKNDDSKRLNVIRAESGIMKLSADKRWLYFTLFNGVRYDEMTGATGYMKTRPFNKMKFAVQKMTIDLSSLDLKFSEREAYKGDHRLMNIWELGNEIDSFENKKAQSEKENAQYLGKFFHLKEIAKIQDFELFANPDTSAKPIQNTENILSNYPKNLNTQTLQVAINNSRAAKGMLDGLMSTWKMYDEESANYRVEWHKKFTLSVIVMLLFLISAPLGAIIRKGGIGMPLVISVIMFIVFYAINIAGEKIGKEGILPLWLGMWTSSFFLLPIGLFITYKATQDSSVLSLEKYIKWFVYYLITPIEKLLVKWGIIKKKNKAAVS